MTHDQCSPTPDDDGLRTDPVLAALDRTLRRDFPAPFHDDALGALRRRSADAGLGAGRPRPAAPPLWAGVSPAPRAVLPASDPGALDRALQQLLRGDADAPPVRIPSSTGHDVLLAPVEHTARLMRRAEALEDAVDDLATLAAALLAAHARDDGAREAVAVAVHRGSGG